MSRSAQIPTGWEIVRDLLGKLATATGDSPGQDTERWYVEKYQEDPDYSKLLNELSKTPHERQKLLRPYFEPDEQQRIEGIKSPTMAHQSIARLVAKGFIKIIVTTNFDRLIENALEAEGVVPTVLSTEEQIKGASPLDHIECCICKVHGDYMDHRIRNTSSELAEYPSVLNQLLCRIFDEYGLIVCGWSADWDTALRNVMYQVTSRRFAIYWTLHGASTDHARRLIHHRRAQVISIDSADGFFQSLHQKVESLEQFTKPHPLSTEAAVASLKRLLTRSEDRIQLQDLIDATVDQVLDATTGERFETSGPMPDRAAVTERLTRYESACTTLLSMSAVGGYWLDEGNCRSWQRCAERLSMKPSVLGQHYPIWSHLQYYPGVLFLYALGLGAVERNHLGLLDRIFMTQTTAYVNGVAESSSVLEVYLSHRDPDDHWKNRVEGLDNRLVTVSDRIHDAIRHALKRLIPSDEKFDYVFDLFEIMAAIAFARKLSYLWFPPGSYLWRRNNRSRILEEMSTSISTLSSDSPFVASGLIGEHANDCLEWIKRFSDETAKTALQMRAGPSF